MRVGGNAGVQGRADRVVGPGSARGEIGAVDPLELGQVIQPDRPCPFGHSHRPIVQQGAIRAAEILVRQADHVGFLGQITDLAGPETIDQLVEDRVRIDRFRGATGQQEQGQSRCRSCERRSTGLKKHMIRFG